MTALVSRTNFQKFAAFSKIYELAERRRYTQKSFQYGASPIFKALAAHIPKYFESNRLPFSAE